MDTVLRIGNASGFYGDRFAAFREMLDGGQLDVLTGDYLAELTMLILARQRSAHPDGGYAGTFLRQMEDCLAIAVDRGVTIVSNAGGLNPAGLATALRDLARRLGVRATIASVEGDDLTGRAAELGLGSPLAANAYLGGWGIAECIRSGANVVVTGRVPTRASWSGPRRRTSGGNETPGMRLPERPSPATFSSVVRRRRAATTASSRNTMCATPGFPSPKSTPTDPA